MLNKEPTSEPTTSLTGMVDVGQNWIMDTGATDHMLSNFQFLESPIACVLHSPCVQLPNGSSVSITHVGIYTIQLGLQLTKVLYVPNFYYNIFSISKLTNDLNCVVSFSLIFALYRISQVER